jgi:hypothetical protein
MLIALSKHAQRRFKYFSLHHDHNIFCLVPVPIKNLIPLTFPGRRQDIGGASSV